MIDPQADNQHRLQKFQIVAVSLSIRQHIALQTKIKAVRFITCYLLLPPKKAVLAALGIPLTPGGKPHTQTEIVRKAESDVSTLRLTVIDHYRSYAA